MWIFDQKIIEVANNLFTLILKLFKAQDAHQGYTSGCYIDVVQDFVVWPITEVNYSNDLG